MEHTKIVSPSDLEVFADLRDSETVIPELISVLIQHSVKDITQLRIPFGESIGLPGMDGLVQTNSGFRQFVPKNTSYWEFGRGAKARDKATQDYRKRTDALDLGERSNASFVFVTPRSKDWDVTSQQKWIGRRKGDGWKEVKVIDGVQVCDWLREFPGVGKWLLQRIGVVKSIGGLRTPTEHWDLLKAMPGPGDPQLPSALFLLGRDEACKQLERLLNQEVQQLLFAVESENDAEDFVSAFLASSANGASSKYRHRCLFISEPEAWQSFSAMQEFHILVASSRLDLPDSNEHLHLAARGRGHGIVIPVSGHLAGDVGNVVPLRSPSRSDVESTLKEAGFTAERASACAGVGSGSLSVMKRFLRGLGSLPPYATWENARLLGLAQLVGKWSDGNEKDRMAIEELSGKAYGEWIQTAHEESLRADTPLIQRNGIWKIISRGEAWTALGPRLTGDDLKKFRLIATQILSETDPRIEMTDEERLSSLGASTNQTYSRAIRDGITETLALLGGRGNALTSVLAGEAETAARIVVRSILEKASWQTWASLHQELPLLAEAAPDEVLDALDSSLQDLQDTPLRIVFQKEGSAGTFGGWNYITGILWSLETLAWSPDYFGRATMILADLAAIDPGGNWSNRPKNSLTDIFLPWRSHSLVSLDERKVAIESILGEHPDVGWNLLLSLLPNSRGISSGTRKPIWRELIPAGRKDSVSQVDYFTQVQVYADLSTQVAAHDTIKLAQLVDRLPDLPAVAKSKVLDHLLSKQVVGLPDELRYPLWEGLVELAHKHRRYADAQWAMPAEEIAQIEEVAQKLQPQQPHMTSRRLFSERDFDLYDDNKDWDKQRKLLDQTRRDTVAKIMATEGTKGVIDFARSVESPSKVGGAWGEIPDALTDQFLIPVFFASEDSSLLTLVRSFIWRRYWTQGLDWAKRQLNDTWTHAQKMFLLVSLPPEPKTWEWAESVLLDKAADYWNQAPINPWGMEAEDLLQAASKTSAAGNSVAAIDCLYLLAHKKVKIPIELAADALLGPLAQPSPQRAFNVDHCVEVITWLQTYTPEDSDKLFHIEWAYLEALNREIGRGAPVTLERKLGTSPSFFVEVVSAIFRSDKEEATDRAEVTDHQRAIARNAYTLLRGWRLLPGMDTSGNFDGQRFKLWLEEAKKLTRKSGHFRIAMDQIGQALAHSPPDPDGLWLHRSIAEALNGRDVPTMRNALTTGLFNSRGVHGFSRGREEQQIADAYKQKATALANAGFSRVADEVRSLANRYEMDAKREANRDPFE